MGRGVEAVYTQESFHSGEISPLLHSRSELDRYKNAVAISENGIITRHGPWVKRSGTKFINEVPDSTKKSRLRRFVYSTRDAYQLLFSENVIWVYKNGARVGSVAITTTYAESELFDLRFTQSADFLYIFHKDHPIRTLTRSSDTVWTLSDLLDIDGPYLAINTDTGHTLQPSGTTGTITITSSQALFSTNDVNRLVRIKHSSTWGYARITGFQSDTVVDAEVQRDFAAATAVSEWRLGSWAIDLGYPRCGEFYDNRLVVGGNIAQPNTYWTSEINNFESFAPSDPDGTVKDTHGFTKTLESNEVNAIEWMRHRDTLVVGTSDGTWSVKSGVSGEAISASNAQAIPESRDTASKFAPYLMRKSLIFTSSSRLKVHSAQFNLITDGLNTPEVSISAEHISRPGLGEMAGMTEPNPIVWFIRDDGQLVGLTIDADNEVVGFHRHIPGGVDAEFESVSAIPASDGTKDVIYVVVKRTINGGTKRYVEILENLFRVSSTVKQEDGFFVDSGVSYDFGMSPTDTLTGLNHLEGETINILADGAVHKPLVVSSGQVVLDYDVTKAHAGLKYDAVVQLLKPPYQDRSGPITGKRIDYDKIIFDLFETLELWHGKSRTDMERIHFRGVGNDMDTAPPLFTGRLEVDYRGDDGYYPPFWFKSDTPTPLTVAGVTFNFKYYSE